ncbi:MAG: polysaccharide biosynthesis tyrosine autokinase [Leptolyngbya sp. SIO4C1]|nr:polysaccharide biosynthesis tyrosine autokinase [Leptolyngbya sp. SIO4C1]
MEPKEHFVEEIDLRRYWLVIKRRWLPASVVFLASVAASMFASMSEEVEYRATGEMLLQLDRTSSLTGVAQELSELESLTVEGNPLDTQASLITSAPILRDTIEALNIRNEEDELIGVGNLKDGLEVSTSEQTDIIKVAYQSGNPELSAAIVNQIMASYIAFNIQSNRSEVRAAREFLEAELPKAEAEVNQLSEALQQFNEQNRIINLEAEATATVGAIADLDQRIANSQSQLAEVDSRVNQLREKLGLPLEDALTLTDLTRSKGVQQVFDQWQAAQTELATARTRYTDAHPNVRTLAREEAALRAVLEERMLDVAGGALPVSDRTLQFSELKQQLAADLVRAEIDRASLFNQLSTLASTRDAYVDWADIFPSLETTQLDLQQKLAYARNTYEGLLRRLQEVRLAENQNVGSARIIEQADVPANPVATGQDNYLLLGAGAGVLLGIAVAFFLDLIDRTIKSVKDGEKIFNYVLLGVIPRFETHKESDWQDDAYSADGSPSTRIVTSQRAYPMISGAYQMLQANLRFMSSDKKLKSLVITSSAHGEGKSEVCANLAASIAQTDRRVLLIDADMRSPDQHHL